MTNSQRLAAVRRCLDRWIEGQNSEIDVEIHEAVLIRDGYYVGRRFKLAQFHAVWFMEEDEIKIHDSQGVLLARLDSTAIDAASQATGSRSDQSSEPADEGMATIPMPQSFATDDFRRSENATRSVGESSELVIRRAA